jgi:hypothetical protein
LTPVKVQARQLAWRVALPQSGSEAVLHASRNHVGVEVVVAPGGFVLARLPLLEAGFNYFRAVGGLNGTILLGFLRGDFPKRV